MKTFFSLILLFVLLFAGSCKDENPYTIPYVAVNFRVYPNGIDSDLGVSRYKYFPQYGYRGVLVYRLNSDQFYVYDRACTYDTQNPKAIVAVDQTNSYAVCPVCGSKYLLVDGYPFQGPTKNPLLKYHTNYSGDQLYVSN